MACFAGRWLDDMVCRQGVGWHVLQDIGWMTWFAGQGLDGMFYRPLVGWQGCRQGVGWHVLQDIGWMTWFAGQGLDDIVCRPGVGWHVLQASGWMTWFAGQGLDGMVCKPGVGWHVLQASFRSHSERECDRIWFWPKVKCWWHPKISQPFLLRLKIIDEYRSWSTPPTTPLVHFSL